ncbi:helix-turn-helix domain-containing protein [Streptomyces venezuelae]|uniref:helix-turn-helix domain-containing protein n=1 Tax=Streptomyces venezuelae TaxID=54571 RepID=UPI0036633086
MPTSEISYYIDSPLLRRLMKRTGTGQSVTVRELADATGLAIGTVGALRNGAQRTLTEDKARRLAAAIGVDLGILFIPCERAGRALLLRQAGPTAVPA